MLSRVGPFRAVAAQAVSPRTSNALAVPSVWCNKVDFPVPRAPNREKDRDSDGLQSREKNTDIAPKKADYFGAGSILCQDRCQKPVFPVWAFAALTGPTDSPANGTSAPVFRLTACPRAARLGASAVRQNNAQPPAVAFFRVCADRVPVRRSAVPGASAACVRHRSEAVDIDHGQKSLSVA